MDFENRVALVTGAASGIGKAAALALAGRGAQVAVCDLNGAGAEATVAESGGRGMAVELDVTDAASVRAGVARVLEALGRVDVLVNSAGWDRIVPFVESDEELWDRVISVNFRGVLATTHAVLPHMIERGEGGAIVNVASEAGRAGSSGEAVYSGAKAAVIAFTRAIARESARHGIRANTVVPGLTETPMLQGLIDAGHGGLMEAIAKATPLRRYARPEEVAEAICFLASDRASFTTGETLSVGGGLVMA